MAVSVVMPALEMAQDTGRLVAWLKREGETVARGEPLIEVETDKAVVEVEAQADGVLAGVCAREGDVIPVGRAIAWILEPGEPIPAADTLVGAAPLPPAAPRRPMSPKARRLAAERGIDPSNLRGSGPAGAVRAADLEASAPDLESPGTAWRLMAERTTASWKRVPQLVVTRDADAGALVDLRRRHAPAIEADHGVKLTYTDLLVAIAGRILPRHRRINASWIDGRVRVHSAAHVAVAVAIDEGVVAPVVRSAHRATLVEIARRRADFVDRARTGRLRPADLSGATFTISNLGAYGVRSFTALVNPPEAAVLAVGRIAERVVAVDGRAAVRPTLALSLTCDHRVADGARAAAFLDEVAAAIEQPDAALS